MNRVLDLPVLQTLLRQETGTILLDVQSEEVFAQAHLLGAKNACVYNVTFLADCAGLIPQKSALIVVYASSGRSKAARTAAEKLSRAGYAQVSEFTGGLETWAAAGLPVEAGAGATPEIPAGDRVFQLDTAGSVIRWSGRNFNSIHTGTLRLASGQIKVSAQTVASARFVIDMLSLQNEDIPDLGMRRVLIEHLSSDDFFQTAQHPVAELQIDRALPIRGAAEGVPNFLLHGQLALNGVSAPLHFPATVNLVNDRLLATARLEIDRTRWGVVYGSNRVYEKIGKHFVDDLIQLEIQVEAA